ncbi:TRAP transporter large permease [Halomonas elongata]|uniref:TRAP transporter large permease protein n=1 Tax=Halomonas elongata (strain ATCC 33173 / DSM 2581 / NBRC 15536 / NCIMB 2198 / 1H9) TaxID=768066 RepID=E1V4T0_HALED|nr:TRAP transporter large permease [Halomonas elongata]WBF18219.1 TRAP transporter large permease [Halomonas elongata]WPU47070.1 TRAP transporter large permease [Halomonas elongata DSM 2581]CBV40979.1 TRAP transporter large transmembrane protein (probable substrate D-glucuronate) [Halomonas elongata DSM 2581]
MTLIDSAVLFGTFFLLLALGLPIVFAIGIASLVSIATSFALHDAALIVSQRMLSGLDSFTLLAIAFFILAGALMNRGGIAIRLIDLARLIVGRLPGSLAHCNVVANMLFGAISGSAVASCAAVGSVMTPLQRSEGYDPGYAAAVNIASSPAGLLIPPSSTFIVYSLVSGGTSIAALFLAGYLPGLMMGLGLMLVAGIIAKRRGYSADVAERQPILPTLLHALPSVLLMVIVIGGIVAGVFTATEASAIAVIYTLILTMAIYRTITFRALPAIVLEAAMTTAIVLPLISVSGAMSWAMSLESIPQQISAALLSLSDNPLVILLLINLILLAIGMFMDITPALLIFTPIFLPIVTQFGMDPVHFGVLMAFNLCIGICTPPVGSALFVGSSIAGVSIGRVGVPLLPMFVVLFAMLMAITYLPQISLFLPNLLLGD